MNMAQLNMNFLLLVLACSILGFLLGWYMGGYGKKGNEGSFDPSEISEMHPDTKRSMGEKLGKIIEEVLNCKPTKKRGKGTNRR